MSHPVNVSGKANDITGKSTYNALTNSFRPRFSLHKISTRACAFDTGGGTFDERLVVAEADIVCGAARAQIGVLQAREGTSWGTRQGIYIGRNDDLCEYVPGGD